MFVFSVCMVQMILTSYGSWGAGWGGFIGLLLFDNVFLLGCLGMV
jgi:hypothetical protein